MNEPEKGEKEYKSDAETQVPKGYGDPAREPQPAPGVEEQEPPDALDVSEGDELPSEDDPEENA